MRNLLCFNLHISASAHMSYKTFVPYQAGFSLATLHDIWVLLALTECARNVVIKGNNYVALRKIGRITHLFCKKGLVTIKIST